MIQWLYRYIFRGWSILLVGGILTSLWLGWQAVHSQTQHSVQHAVTAPQAATPASAQH